MQNTLPAGEQVLLTNFIGTMAGLALLDPQWTGNIVKI